MLHNESIHFNLKLRGVEILKKNIHDNWTPPCVEEDHDTMESSITPEIVLRTVVSKVKKELSILRKADDDKNQQFVLFTKLICSTINPESRAFYYSKQWVIKVNSNIFNIPHGHFNQIYSNYNYCLNPCESILYWKLIIEIASIQVVLF